MTIRIQIESGDDDDKPDELSRINEKIEKVLREKEALLYELQRIKESYELEAETGIEERLIELDMELSAYLDEKNRILAQLLFMLPWLSPSKE